MTSIAAFRPWGRRRSVLALLAAGLLALLAAGVAVLWVGRPVIEGQLRAQLLPRLSAQLGRPIDVQTIRVSLFPLRGELENVRIGGRPGEPPLAQVQHVHANLELWPLLVSRGHEVKLRSVELDNPSLNLLHQPDGSWSLPGGPVPRPGAASRAGAQNTLVISELQIRDGAVHFVDRASGARGDVIALEKVEARARNVGSDKGSSLALSAALGADHPNLKADLTSSRTGERWDWRGTVTVDSLEVDRLHGLLPAGVDLPISGGQLALTASVSTLADGAFEAKGHLDARQLSMRGRPVNASTDFELRAPGPTLALTRLQVTGPGVELAGTASMKSPRELQFSLAGPLLDLDALLSALPEARAASPTSPPEQAPPESAVSSLSASGHLAIARVTLGRLELEQVNADARLERGQVTVTRASAKLYGGAVNVSQAHADLTRNVPPWSLSAQLSGVDFGRATQALAGAPVLQGTLQAQLGIAGSGAQWAQVREGMTGSGSFSVHGGAWTSTDMEQALAAPLVGAVKEAGHGLSGGAAPSGPQHPTPLRGLDGSFDLSKGELRFREPLRAQSSFGDASLTGTIGLDQRLHLKGTVQLQPAFVTKVVALQPIHPVTAPLTIQGTIASPKIEVDQGEVAKGLLASTPPENLIRRGLHKLFGGHKS